MLDIIIGVIIFGILHGINPSHGWIIAVLYAMHNPRRVSGLIASSIIASAHFVSSITVVIAYIFIDMVIEIPYSYMQYVSIAGLSILAYIFWREKGEDLIQTQHGHLHNNNQDVEHEHKHWHKGIGYHTHIHTHYARRLPTLIKLASFALVLGFLHEEEFVILALVISGIDPLLLILAYASSVAVALITITMVTITIYGKIQDRFIQYNKFMPKITSIVLISMTISFTLELFM